MSEEIKFINPDGSFNLIDSGRVVHDSIRADRKYWITPDDKTFITNDHSMSDEVLEIVSERTKKRYAFASAILRDGEFILSQIQRINDLCQMQALTPEQKEYIDLKFATKRMMQTFFTLQKDGKISPCQPLNSEGTPVCNFKFEQLFYSYMDYLQKEWEIEKSKHIQIKDNSVYIKKS